MNRTPSDAVTPARTPPTCHLNKPRRRVATFIKESEQSSLAWWWATQKISVGFRSKSITVADLENWLTTYKHVDGTPFPFIIADVGWTRPGTFAEVRELQTWVQSHEMQFGVIYNGDASDTSDVAWLTHAEDAFCQYERPGLGNGRTVVIQSGNSHPSVIAPNPIPQVYASHKRLLPANNRARVKRLRQRRCHHLDDCWPHHK